MLSYHRAAARRRLTLAVALPALVLAGCGSSSAPGGSGFGVAANPGTPATTAPAPTPSDFPGTTNTVPATPAAGASRPGTSYNVFIQGPKTQDKIAFTVFEPTTLVGGQTYPLLIQSHGFGGSRTTAGSAAFDSFRQKGYGVISLDERGHGESGGTIRVMDPDAEGQNLLAILDWAEARLDWLRYGPSADGTDPRNLVLGSMGGSYGGMFQFLIHNIDPKRRLDAMVPEIAPNNLNYALFPGTVAKSTWNATLFGAGNGGGAQGGTAANFDPYIRDNFAPGLLGGIESPGFRDFFYYHSNEYFCGSGTTVATNGGPGTSPGYAPSTGSKVNVLLFQGIRDTLFNLTDGIANYECLARQGGDVRLLTYLSGHNSLQVVPDPGTVFIGGPQAALDSKCGTLDVATARLAFFDQYLRGVPNAAAGVPTKPCLALAVNSAVLVDHIIHAAGAEGREVAIPATNVVLGVSDVPVAVPLGITGADGGTLVAGVPQLKLKIAQAVGAPGSPTVFVGLGRTRNGVPGVYDLVDNMILPVTGAGEHVVEMVAVATQLEKGDQLALLVYGLHSSFAATGAAASQVAVQPVTVSGAVRLPLPAPGTYTPAP